jgi:dethiobiotin synthetase
LRRLEAYAFAVQQRFRAMAERTGRCINHALLTAQAIANDGLPLVGWVANRINPGLAHYAEIIEVLSKKLPGPLVGELPYLPRAEQRELAQYIDLTRFGRALAVDRVLA